MKKFLILSLIVNMLAIPLATIYIVRKVQFYREQQNSNNTNSSASNMFYLIRNSEFQNFNIDSNSVVFFGDSHIQNFEVSEAFKSANVKNRGIIMDGTNALLGRIGYVVNKHPKKVFIEIGINDLLAGDSTKVVAANLSRIVASIKETSPKTQIFVHSILPTNWNIFNTKIPVLPKVIEANRIIKANCLKSNAQYIDLCSKLIKGKGLNSEYDCGDSLHLNGKGYLVWQNTISNLVNE